MPLRVEDLRLPPKYRNLRSGQASFLSRARDLFTGKRVVSLSAPTGFGKSLVARFTKDAIDAGRVLILTATKGLERQYREEFPSHDHLRSLPRFFQRDLERAVAFLDVITLQLRPNLTVMVEVALIVGLTVYHLEVWKLFSVLPL